MNKIKTILEYLFRGICVAIGIALGIALIVALMFICNDISVINACIILFFVVVVICALLLYWLEN